MLGIKNGRQLQLDNTLDERQPFGLAAGPAEGRELAGAVLHCRDQAGGRCGLGRVASSLSKLWCMIGVCHALTWISTMRRARRSCAVIV